MDYVLFGIQGSGKGTQGIRLAEKLNGAYFEMGQQLRDLAKQDSALGKKVKQIIEAGNLVPTPVVMEIVEDFVHRCDTKKSIIFDGIPRTDEQRAAFEQLLQKLDRKYMGIVFELSRNDAIKRLTTRRLCSKGKEAFPADFSGNECPTHHAPLVTRADDTPDSIKRRLDLFERETLPIVASWKSQNKMLAIDGRPAIDEVTKLLFTGFRLEFTPCLDTGPE